MGAMAGNIMPGFMASALSVAIYGMFLALIIPPAKKHRAVCKVVIGAMACLLYTSGFVCESTGHPPKSLFLWHRSRSSGKERSDPESGKRYPELSGKYSGSCLLYTSRCV